MANPLIAELVKRTFSDIDWDRFEDIDRSLNFDLWYGTASDYFGEDKAEPLEHYEWRGFEQAEKDLREILEPLPWEMYYDIDGDGITETDPESYEGYWRCPCIYCGELLSLDKGTWVDDTEGDVCSGNDNLENENEQHVPDESNYIWVGGEWELFNVREVLMFVETFKQVF